MCTGIEIAGLVTTLAGAAASEGANVATKNKMNDAVKAQLTQQQGFQQRGMNLFQNSEQQSTPQAAQNQLAQGAQQAAQNYQSANQSNPLSSSVASTILPPSEQQGAGGSSGQSSAYQGLLNNAASQLQGAPNFQLQQYLKDLNIGDLLGVNTQLSKNAASTLPLQLDIAQGQYDTLSGLGSLAQTGGGLLGLYGAINSPSAAAGGTRGIGYGGTPTGLTNMTGFGPYGGYYPPSTYNPFAQFKSIP